MTIGDGHDLQSPRFAGDDVLEACYDNERFLRRGDSGSAVQKIQQALMSMGFSSPRLGADGDFGEETEIAVRSYQTARGLTADGIIGPSTIGNLDSELIQPEPPNPSSTLQLSNDGFNFIKRHEGLPMRNGLAYMYNDSAGHCTIGIGHLIHLGNCDGSASEESYKNGITEAQAYDLFKRDLAKYEEAVKSSVRVSLTQYQYDALVSFTYNIGTAGFKGSSVLTELNQGNYDIVPDRIMLWNKPAIIIGRRTDEANLFRTGNYGN